jgi:hypothetical protein
VLLQSSKKCYFNKFAYSSRIFFYRKLFEVLNLLASQFYI